VRRLKVETPLAITLSLGERPRDELAAWRAAGADRYLLRFETSNAALFAHIHPARTRAAIERRTMLRWLRELDYEVGSGVMIGLPGQTYADLANDLELFRALDLDMIGVGPYLPHPDTPLGRGADPSRAGADAQVPNDELMTYKVIALARLLCPRANIPSTTALATLNRAAGRMLGLQRGANVVMPNLTPDKFRACYAIYPAKACAYEEPRAYDALLRAQLQALGRGVDSGRGDALNWRARRPPATTSAPEDTRGGRSRCAPAD
jgi:biotin synthase